MYCPICGKKNIDGAKFCFACGTSLAGCTRTNNTAKGPGRVYKNKNQGLAPGIEMNPAPAGWQNQSPKGNAGKVVGLLAVVVAAVLIVTLIVSAPAKAPKNAMAALYDGVKNLLASEGFDLNSKVYLEYGRESYEFAYDYSVLFGEDVKSTVTDISFTLPDESASPFGFGLPGGQVRMISSGDFAVIGIDWDEYGLGRFDESDPDNYYKMDMTNNNFYQNYDELEEMLYDEIGVSINFNSFIANHRIDSEQVIKALNSIIHSPYIEYEMSYILEALNIRQIPDVEDIIRVFEHFVYVKCEEKGFVDQFLFDVKASGNTYEFTVNMDSVKGFLDAFADYLDELQRDTRALSRIKVDEGAVRDMNRAFSVISRELKRGLNYMRDDDYGFDLSTKLHVVFGLDRNRVLNTLNLNGVLESYYDAYSLKWNTEVNAPTIDVRALNRFVDRIGKDQDDFENDLMRYIWGEMSWY